MQAFPTSTHNVAQAAFLNQMCSVAARGADDGDGGDERVFS